MTQIATTQKLLGVIKDGMGTAFFKAYFDGDPQLIGLSNLPCVIVQDASDTTTVAYTGTDRTVREIIVKIVLNKRDDWGASDTEDLTNKRIRDIIEARDDDTGQYAAGSIKGILRASGFTLGDTIVNQDWRIRYFVEHRPQDMFTQEAHITMTTTELIVVPNRT